MKRVLASPLQPGLVFIAVLCYCGESYGTSLVIGRSSDYGTTWSWSGHLGWTGNAAVGFELSRHDPRRLWTAIGNSQSKSKILVSNDMGATFSPLFTFNIWMNPYDIYVPGENNPADQTMFAITDHDGFSGELWRSQDGGATWSIVTASGMYPARLDHIVGSYAADSRDAFYVRSKCCGIWSFLSSTDEGTTWQTRDTLPTGHGWMSAVWNWPTDPNRLLTAQADTKDTWATYIQVAMYSSDGGSTWADKTGNWYSTINPHGDYQGNPGSSGGLASVIIVDAQAMALALPDRSTLSLKCQECALNAASAASGSAADPINTHTGGFDYRVTDLSILTSAGPLAFERSYASGATGLYTASLGYGWTDNQEIQLLLPGNPAGDPGSVWFKNRTANQFRFVVNPDGSYSPYPGVLASLTLSGGTYTLVNSAQEVYTFDSQGKLISWTDAQGHGLHYTYTGGLLTRIADDSATRSLSLAYDPLHPGRLQSVSDASGRQVSYSYDATTGDLNSVTDVLGQTWRYTYDTTSGHPAHLLTGVIDPRQVTRPQVDYDAQGRAVRQYDGLGQRIVTLTYNAGDMATISDPLGHVSSQSYDTRNTLIGETNALGGTTRKGYDANFRPATVTDPRGNTTSLSWGSNGANLTQMTNALNQSTGFSYDNLNNLTRAVDARGYTTIYTYTGTLLTASSDPLGHTTTYAYTTAADQGQPPNLLKTVTDPLGRTTRYQYDTLGQRTVITDAAGIVTQFGYDTLGRVVTTTTAVGTALQQVALTTYDPAGRVVKTTRNYLAGQLQNDQNRYNLMTRYSYDAVGNQTWITDTLGSVTRNFYDNNNQRIQTIRNYRADQPAQNDQNQYNLVTAYAYNSLGLQTIVTDTLGRATRTDYDPLHRPVTVTVNYQGEGRFDPALPDRNIQTITQYDANGNIVSRTEYANVVSGDARSLARTTVTAYDALNRPTAVTVNYQDGLFDSTKPDEDLITVTQYDANGNATSTTDPLGHVTRTDYDALNRPVTITVNYKDGVFDPHKPDEDIQSVTHYDASGQVDARTDDANVSGMQRVMKTLFDPTGRPVTQIANYGDGLFDPHAPDQDVSRTTTYGSAGEVQKTTQWQGGPGLAATLPVTTSYSYDNLGRLLSTTQPLTGTQLGTTSYGYDALGRQVIVTDTLNHAIRTGYDALGQVVTTTINFVGSGAFSASAPDQNIQTITEYDPLGNVLTRTEYANVVSTDGQSLARTTVTAYDALNRPVKTIENYLDSTAGQLPHNRPAPGRGLTTGLLPRQVFPLIMLNTHPPDEDLLTLITYDGAGNRVNQIDPGGNLTAYSYDALGQVITVTTPVSGSVATRVFGYDALGRQVSTKDPLGHETRIGYDGLGRPTIVTVNYQDGLFDPTRPDEDLVTLNGYDAAGNQVAMTQTVTNSVQVVTHFAYDGMNRLIGVVENDQPGGPVDSQTNVASGYGYDSLGNRLVITDANVHLTTFRYDLANRLVSERDALGHGWTYAYDAGGNRTRLLDAKGQTTQYGYDALNRPTSITYPAPEPNVRFTYNGRGERTQMTDGAGTTTFEYDAMSRPIRVSDPFSATVTYEYDPLGHRTLLRYPDGTPLTYIYGPDHRLSLVASPTTTVAYTYDAAGQVIGIHRSQGATTVDTTYSYDQVGQISQIQHTRGAQHSLEARYRYSYNGIGNRTQVVETVQQPLGTMQTTTLGYSYDPLSRLTGADSSDGSYYHYTYDAVGNRLSEQTQAGTTSYSYDAANRLSAVNGSTYTWDNNGNLLNDGASTYSYNTANRLTQVVRGGTTSSYTYNGLGDRLSQTINGVTMSYTLDLDGRGGLSQVLSDGANTYLYGSERLAQQSMAGTSYFLGDALDSVRQLTDVTGTVQFAGNYQPFGTGISTAGTVTTPYGFAGEWADASGLLNLRARYYAPAQGRFISADTIAPNPYTPQALNRYPYSLNNPVKYTDPTGHYVFEQETPNPADYYYVVDGYTHGNTYFFNPRESEQLFGVTTAQRVSMASCIDPENKAGPFIFGALGMLSGRLGSYPSGGLASTVPISVQSDALGDPDLGNVSNGASLDDVAAARRALGLPSVADEIAATGKQRNVVAILRADGTEFWGANGRKPALYPVNAISKDHAEIDALNQLYQVRQSSGAMGGSAVLTVDMKPCDSCGLYNGIRSAVEATGLDELIVVYPGGTVTIVPRK